MEYLKNQKMLSIFMLVLISISTIFQPLITFADTDIDEFVAEESQVDVDVDLEDDVVEEITEEKEEVVETEKEVKQEDEEPVKNKGDPVVKLKQEVEEKKHLDVKSGEEFNYNVKAVIPNNIEDVEKFTITNVLDKDLTIVDTVVLVDGTESNFVANVDGYTVKLILSNQDLENVAGKELNLQITSSVSDGVEEKEITNVATSQFDDGKVFESNAVKVNVVKEQENEKEEEVIDEDEQDEQDEGESVEREEVEGEQDGDESVEREEEQDESVDVEGSDVILAEADEIEEENKEVEKDTSLFNVASMAVSSDIGKDVVVSNLSATPNTGSKDIWETQFGKLKFDLDIPDNTKSGDVFEVKIDGITNIQDFNSVKTIKTTDGRVIGEFSYKRSGGENILTATMNDEIDNKINVKVKMDLGFKIDDSYRGNDTPTDIKHVEDEVTVYTEGSNEKITIKSKLFNILSKISIFGNIYGNKDSEKAEIQAIARISSNESTVKEGRLTITPEKGFTIPKDPKIELQGWVYTKQSDGTYKVSGKKFQVEVLESKKNKLVLKTPKLVNTGDTIELLRVAVFGEISDASKIDFNKDKTDLVQVKGEFDSNTDGYKNLVYIGDSNVYESDSIGADAEEIEGTIRVIKQDKETKERLEGAVFEVRDSKGKLVKELTTNKKGEASIGKLPKGEYTVKEVKAPKGYKNEGRTKTIKVEDSIVYDYKVDNVFNPTTPPVVKDVEGKEHLEIEQNKIYRYNVKTTIPKDLNGYKNLVIADKLDDRLDVVDAKVLVNGKVTDYEATIEGQTVTMKLDRKQLNGIAGQEINLQITAKIKSGTDIELIDNKATIQLNDNPKVDSNVVTVIPPEPETPGIIKDVEGEDHLEIGHEKAYNYNVKTTVPVELGGYKDLTITDKLDGRLDVVGATVLVDGKVTEYEATIEGQTVTMKLDRKQLNGIAGQEINLQIIAKIKSGTDIELIDNKANIQLNDNPKVDSNVVTVIPPEPETPVVEKDVEGKEHLDIERNKEYKYNVKTNIPTELGGYKDLTIVDQLDERLTVVKVDVLVDGETSEFEATIEGRLVTLNLDREQLETVSGKEINIQITSKINGDVDVELIDNIATIQLNDNPSEESNVVTVIPPEPITPSIVKDVEGKEHLEIDKEKSYKFLTILEVTKH